MGDEVQYDAFADDYDADSGNAFNALYELLASLALLPPLAGKRVLDAGCGAGHHSAAMVELGASVVGVDGSPAMLDRARRRCPTATFHQADLGKPLTFLADASFDVVLCALTLHYVRDWVPVLREFRRVLVPEGAVVISTHHPASDVKLSSGDYFATELVHDQWTKNGRTIEVAFWRRPLTDMVAAMQEAGFAVDRLVEPMPVPEAEVRFPEEWKVLTTQPNFLFFRLRAS